MSPDIIAAGRRLADTLAEENAALVTLDLTSAVAMLDEKRRAIEEFVAAQSTESVAVPRETAELVARRLQSLANENKALITRALAAQGRVLAVIARAAAAPSGYDASGTASRTTRPAAFALLARA